MRCYLICLKIVAMNILMRDNRLKNPLTAFYYRDILQMFSDIEKKVVIFYFSQQELHNFDSIAPLEMVNLNTFGDLTYRPKRKEQ